MLLIPEELGNCGSKGTVVHTGNPTQKAEAGGLLHVLGHRKLWSKRAPHPQAHTVWEYQLAKFFFISH